MQGHSGAGQSGFYEAWMKVVTRSFTPAAVAAAVSAEQTVTGITGVRAGDVVIATGPATGNASMIGAARVSANDTVALTFANPTAGALTPAAGTFTFIILRPKSRA